MKKPRRKARLFEYRKMVGMIRLERTTPTSRTWCASQLRYIPKKNKLA